LQKEIAMTRTVAAALLSLFTVSSAFAQAGSACTTNAVGKDGKPLAGAAKASFMKKCCEDAAVASDGKPLSGAAKTSFVKKCQAG
jgi:hypothetical protein